MENLHSIFQLAGGTGLFLFAMYLIEEALKNLSGRKFKLFLQRISKNNISAVAGGTLITAILQSSSMVSFMVLAFVGAGVFTMKNAMAIILGANLGTTLASWLVATVGFKTDIDIIAFPIICIGGFLIIFFSNRKKFKYISYFLLGFGLLFVALSFMKTAMESQVSNFNFAQFGALTTGTYLLLGFFITMVVQSSSVTMALTLSALHAAVIDFPTAAVIVLGSETGTTIKIILGSIGGNAAKKRVALGNIIFNVILTVLALLFLKPIICIITNGFQIQDNLIALVTFSTLNNLIAILLFLPFLNFFAKFLEHFFRVSNGSIAAFIGHASTSEPQTALDLFRRETKYFIHNSMFFNMELLKINTEILKENTDYNTINVKRKFYEKSQEEKYDFLKQLQGELQAFYLLMRSTLEGGNLIEFNQLISAVRSAMHSVKSMKDIASNSSNLRHSSKEIKHNFFLKNTKETEQLYLHLYAILQAKDKVNFEDLQLLFDTIKSNFTEALNSFYTEVQLAPIENIDITTVINFNREQFTANKAMLMAIKELILDEKQSEYFNEIPTYTT